MPTNYTGDPTATQAPSDPPSPECTLTTRVPAGGDAPNASTFAQGYKLFSDAIAWLFRPIAKALDFAMWIMGWRTAVGHKRFLVDHLGFPGGQHVHVPTYWCTTSPVGAGASFTGTGSSGTRMPADPKWVYTAFGSAVGVDGIMISSNPNGPACTAMQLTALASAVSGNYATLASGPYGLAVPWMHIVFECLASGIDRGLGYTVLDLAAVGLGDWLGLNGVGLDDFIGFESRNTANWYCVTRAGGAETVTASGIGIVRDPYNGAGPPMQRLRVEFHGEAVAEDGLRRVRFYIDGALIATHSAHVPIGPKMFAVLSTQRGPTAGDALAVGPVNIHMSLFPADVS